MVERQLRRRGISDERVLRAMAAVPREHFVPEDVRRSAYNDSALPIGHEPDDLSALGGRRDLPVPEPGRPRKGARDRHRLRVLGRRALASGRPRGQHRAAPRARRGGAGKAHRARHRERRGDRGRRQPRVSRARAVRRDRRPRGVAGGPAQPALPAGAGGPARCAIATGSSDLLTAFIRDNGDLRQETIGPCRFVPLIGAEGFQPPD